MVGGKILAEEKIVHGLPIRFLNRENPDPALRPKSLACPYPEPNFRGNSSGQFEPNLDSALSCFHPHRVHRSIQTFWHTYQRLEYQLSEGKPKGVYFVHCINKQAENGICCLKAKFRSYQKCVCTKTPQHLFIDPFCDVNGEHRSENMSHHRCL